MELVVLLLRIVKNLKPHCGGICMLTLRDNAQMSTHKTSHYQSIQLWPFSARIFPLYNKTKWTLSHTMQIVSDQADTSKGNNNESGKVCWQKLLGIQYKIPLWLHTASNQKSTHEENGFGLKSIEFPQKDYCIVFILMHAVHHSRGHSRNIWGFRLSCCLCVHKLSWKFKASWQK